jgi:hypothetical protein
MIQTAVSKAITTLNEVESKFNLVRAVDPQFFTEWTENLPPLTDAERASLDRIRGRYRYHRADGNLAEGVINLMVLSPLLDLAGFYDPPFKLRSEVGVELTIASATADLDNKPLQGRLDFLVVQNQFWVVLVESKGTAINLEDAIPQTLAYMLATPNPTQPIYGMATNGGEFLFLKCDRQTTPEYDLSSIYSQLPLRNELYSVLQILKRFGQQVLV